MLTIFYPLWKLFIDSVGNEKGNYTECFLKIYSDVSMSLAQFGEFPEDICSTVDFIYDNNIATRTKQNSMQITLPILESVNPPTMFDWW